MNNIAEIDTIHARTTQTDVHIQRFEVPYQYPVYFTENMFAADNNVLIEALEQIESDRIHRFVVFIDEDVDTAWGDMASKVMQYAEANAESIQLVAPPIIISGGEKVKNDPQLIAQLQKQMLDLGIDRHSFVVAMGGGALLDMIGYVAATAHRGLRMVRIPTTVLAQNDSGVGVKNGVNAWGAKNFLGTFAPPFAVINDAAFLKTLSDRDHRAGMAEAVKVALIRDAVFFAELEAKADELAAFEPNAVNYLIRRCAELHMHQIAHGGDPFERGSARPLDYGHWAAHKLESMTNHDIRHGEAVAIGIALDTRYSVMKGYLSPGDDERVCNLLEQLGFELWHPYLEAKNSDGTLTLLSGLREFREHLGGELTITLLTDIGSGYEVNEMSYPLIIDSIFWLKIRAGTR